MKVRTGFVSNSSSASFTIKLTDLAADQLKAFNDHVLDKHPVLDGSITLGYLDAKYDYWDILFWDECITGTTVCNNDCVWELFDELGIPRDRISFHDDSDMDCEVEDED